MTHIYIYCQAATSNKPRGLGIESHVKPKVNIDLFKLLGYFQILLTMIQYQSLIQFRGQLIDDKCPFNTFSYIYVDSKTTRLSFSHPQSLSKPHHVVFVPKPPHFTTLTMCLSSRDLRLVTWVGFTHKDPIPESNQCKDSTLYFQNDLVCGHNGKTKMAQKLWAKVIQWKCHWITGYTDNQLHPIST